MLGDFFEDIFHFIGTIIRLILVLFFIYYFFYSIYNLVVCSILGPMIVKNKDYELVQESTIDLDNIEYSGQVFEKSKTIFNKEIVNDAVSICYSYKDEEGNIILKSFIYEEETTKIIEEDIENPYIIIKEYSKKWLSYVDNFSTYELHIPKGSL